MTKRPMLASLVFAGLFVIGALALKYASARHLVSGDVPMRGYQVLMGLMIAFYGNVIPKNLPRFREGQSSRIQSLQRTSGWLFTLAGLGYAAIWVGAPLAVAAGWSVTVVGATTLFVFGYAVWTHLACRKAAKAH